MSKCEECDANISVPSDALEGEIVTCLILNRWVICIDK